MLFLEICLVTSCYATIRGGYRERLFMGGQLRFLFLIYSYIYIFFVFFVTVLYGKVVGSIHLYIPIYIYTFIFVVCCFCGFLFVARWVGDSFCCVRNLETS